VVPRRPRKFHFSIDANPAISFRFKWRGFPRFLGFRRKKTNNNIYCYSTLKTGNTGQKADKRVNTAVSLRQIFNLHDFALLKHENYHPIKTLSSKSNCGLK